MKRIILSVLAIAMAIGVTTGAAFALFSSTATVSGVTFSTGNASLLVSGTNSGYTGNWSTMVDFLNMYPSNTVYQTRNMWLKNNSTSDIALNLKMQITSYAAGSWVTPTVDVIEFAVVDSLDATNTGWHTLRDWKETGYSITVTPLAKGLTRQFTVYSRVPTNYNSNVPTYTIGSKSIAPNVLVENEASSLSFTNATFTLTGTQN